MHLPLDPPGPLPSCCGLLLVIERTGIGPATGLGTASDGHDEGEVACELEGNPVEANGVKDDAKVVVGLRHLFNHRQHDNLPSSPVTEVSSPTHTLLLSPPADLPS